MSKSLFSNDFYWGAGSSAFQVEGGWDADGKGLTVADVNAFKKSEYQADTKVASDFYHKFEADINLMADLGLKMYRFSISWARIFPDGEGKINQKGIDYYNKIIDLLIERDIEPFITLYHFDLPYHLVEKYNGWESKETVAAFAEYAKTCYENFGDRVKKWQIHNEQNLMIRVNERMNIYEDKGNVEQLRIRMDHNMFLAYAKASDLCHELVDNGQVGPSISSTVTYPATNKPQDVMSAIWNNRLKTDYCIHTHVFGAYPDYYINYLDDVGLNLEITDEDYDVMKKAKVDFIAVNYYRTITTKYLEPTDKNLKGTKIKGFNEVDYNMYGYWEIIKNENLEETEYGAQIDPVGLRIALNDYYSKYHKPLIITENGLGTADELTKENKIHDGYRIDYIQSHIRAISEAINDGVDVFGYCVWSFTDILSSHQGFKKRYGLVYINRTDFELKDLKRIPKDSYYWYKKVIETKGSSIDER
ncbi:glycoside hydrolase family 1 protein [Amphibacillus cookii]|uniref:glycoside hydrolase family 1 protein n=1 Tax=Amphibacillus cookii TaxID=767787 RepID=UPI00195D3FCD|nr:glycoside hydrolase family 1 protein [Amphibacillus cookii]MBM7541638.1 6-phospho-beta-glucosidase [Amphibacillus cookii]